MEEIKTDDSMVDMKPLFNLNHLQTSFDSLKGAIEYLAT
jgi:hypothetical protein